MLQVAGVVSLRRLSESVVSPYENAHTPLAKFGIDRSRRIDRALHLASYFGIAIKAKLLTFVERAVNDANCRPDKHAILGRLEHIDRFFVRRFAVIDHIYPTANSPFYRFGRAGVAVDPLAEIARDVDRGLYLLLGHDRETTVGGGAEVVTGNVELDVVHALTAAQADGLSDLLHAIGNQAKAFEVHMRLAFVAKTSSDGDLRAAGTNTRTGKLPSIDGIPNDHVEAQF